MLSVTFTANFLWTSAIVIPSGGFENWPLFYNEFEWFPWSESFSYIGFPVVLVVQWRRVLLFEGSPLQTMNSKDEFPSENQGH